ncbi:MAG: ASCH domain-containing protein [Pelagimonas sp.]|jgi:uncharacterized protein YhfF|nr:ASCH domain-containing protein [Pelagimonas sp.]
MTLASLKLRYPEAETFLFGDNEKLCQALLSRVLSGQKTATCTALRDVETGTEAMPVVGRRDIALNWDGTPACVIETTEATIRRYCDVDAAFALAEGETETLEGWQREHQAYFARNGGFDPEMKLVCERFRLIEVIT